MAGRRAHIGIDRIYRLSVQQEVAVTDRDISLKSAQF